MDLAKPSPRDFSSLTKLFGLTLLAPGLWLIYHLVVLGFNSNLISAPFTSGLDLLESIGGLEEFKKWRNIFYIGYILAFITAGLLLILTRNKTVSKSQPSTFLSQIIGSLTTSLILTTFSYGIAGFILDIYNLVRKTEI